MSPDGRLIADAIFSMPKPVLAGHLALLEEVNLLSLLTSKASSFMDKTQHDSMGLKVKARAAELSGATSDTNLALRLVAQLSQIVGASPHQYTSEREFDDAATDIITGSVTALRNVERTFTGSSLQDVVQFTVESMFGEVGKRFADLSNDKQADILKAIRDFIAQLPHDQQVQVRNKLGLDDLSDQFLGKAVVSGTFASALAGGVSIGGFGFYTGAVSLVSTMAGLVGLTIPFAVYTSLTSAIAVAANPLFFVPAVAGGGFLLYHNQNEALRKRLAINTIVQLALFGSSLPPGLTTDARMRAVAAWQSACEAIRMAERMRASAQRDLSVAEHRLSSLRDSLRNATEAVESAIADRSKLVSRIRTEVELRAFDIAAGEWGKAACKCGEVLASAQKSQQNARRPVGKAGAFMSPFLHVARAVQTVGAGMHVERLVAIATDTIVDLYLQDALSTSIPVLPLLEEVKKANSAIRSFRAQVAANESAIENQRRSLLSARKLLESAVSAIQKATNTYWGLAS